MDPPRRQAISVEFAGRPYNGAFYVDRGMVHVECAYGRKSTQVGGSAGDPEPLARMILLQLVRDRGE